MGEDSEKDVGREIFEAGHGHRRPEEWSPGTIQGLPVEELFTRLGESLELEGCPPLDLVVIGGSALNVTGEITPVGSRDADVLGEVDSDEGIVPPDLPPVFWKVVREVGEEESLEPDWINTGASFLVRIVPSGMVERLHPEKYGSCLTVHFADRVDQIHFKLRAAADQGGKHTDDLVELDPRSGEITKAGEWVLDHEKKRIREKAMELMERLGFENEVRELTG